MLDKFPVFNMSQSRRYQQGVQRPIRGNGLRKQCLEQFVFCDCKGQRCVFYKKQELVTVYIAIKKEVSFNVYVCTQRDHTVPDVKGKFMARE